MTVSGRLAERQDPHVLYFSADHQRVPRRVTVVQYKRTNSTDKTLPPNAGWRRPLTAPSTIGQEVEEE